MGSNRHGEWKGKTCGLIGVSKASYTKGTDLQRLIMNIIPSNHVQLTIEGDMQSLPTDSEW